MNIPRTHELSELLLESMAEALETHTQEEEGQEVAAATVLMFDVVCQGLLASTDSPHLMAQALVSALDSIKAHVIRSAAEIQADEEFVETDFANLQQMTLTGSKPMSAD